MFKLITVSVLLLIGFKLFYTPNPTPLIKQVDVALVKYKNVVYQCQQVTRNKCGYYIRCGTLNVHCANGISIQYL